MLPPVIINESKKRYVPGDLTIFESLERAIGWMEPVDVENDEYFLFDANGSEYKPIVVGETIEVIKTGDGDVFRLIEMLRSYQKMLKTEKGRIEFENLIKQIALINK